MNEFQVVSGKCVCRSCPQKLDLGPFSLITVSQKRCAVVRRSGRSKQCRGVCRVVSGSPKSQRFIFSLWTLRSPLWEVQPSNHRNNNFCRHLTDYIGFGHYSGMKNKISYDRLRKFLLWDITHVQILTSNTVSGIAWPPYDQLQPLCSCHKIQNPWMEMVIVIQLGVKTYSRSFVSLPKTKPVDDWRLQELRPHRQRD